MSDTQITSTFLSETMVDAGIRETFFLPKQSNPPCCEMCGEVVCQVGSYHPQSVILRINSVSLPSEALPSLMAFYEEYKGVALLMNYHPDKDVFIPEGKRFEDMNFSIRLCDSVSKEHQKEHEQEPNEMVITSYYVHCERCFSDMKGVVESPRDFRERDPAYLKESMERFMHASERITNDSKFALDMLYIERSLIAVNSYGEGVEDVDVQRCFDVMKARLEEVVTDTIKDVEALYSAKVKRAFEFWERQRNLSKKRRIDSNIY
jgi:hypothetical protein